MSVQAVAAAVKAVKSQTALAKILGCTPQNVQHMASTGHVPGKHVLKIETATGVSRSALRPDLYPDSLANREEIVAIESAAQQGGNSAVQASSDFEVQP